MLTIDFDRLQVDEGDRLLDLGCGAGRHTFEALRRGAIATAVDQNTGDLADIEVMVAAMAEAGEIKPVEEPVTLEADAMALPFADGHFDRVIASEILEHIPDDDGAISELIRVLKPGGTLAVTVPRWLPEKICWLLSDAYHANKGGHIRIYRADELRSKLTRGGLRFTHSHHAHSLHSPFWWLKCAVGVDKPDHPAVKAYHKLLVWDMMSQPKLTRVAEAALNPVVGKSVALYFEKPVSDGTAI